MPRILLITTYFATTLPILVSASIVFVQARIAGILIGASLIALMRTGEFYYAAETAPRLSSGNKRNVVLTGVAAAVVDSVVVAIGIAVIELIRSAALAQGLNRRSTDLAAIIAACVVGLIVVSPKVITRLCDINRRNGKGVTKWKRGHY